MAGASRRRAQAEREASEAASAATSRNAASVQQDRSQRQPTGSSAERSTPQSLPRFDGNRDPSPNREVNMLNVNSKLLGDAAGFAAWFALRGLEVPADIPKRPAKLNSQGKEINVKLNNFNVLSMPKSAIYQYDVIIGSGTEKRGLIKAVWHSEGVFKKLGKGWLFDGNRIAWSMDKIPEQVFHVDLDAEKKRTLRPEHQGKNRHRVIVKCTKQVNFNSLNQYLNSGIGFDNSVTEAVLFMDHLMRETPSRNLTAIKKSFFAKGQTRIALGNGIEAFKGVFSSIRMTTTAANRPTLSVNVDVANGTFWTAQKLGAALQQVLEIPNIGEMANRFKEASNNWDASKIKRECKRMAKLSVEVLHRTDEKGMKPVYIIDKILPRMSHEYKMEVTETDADGNRVKKFVKIADYFFHKYKLKLVPNMPLVKMTKASVVLPLDVCFLMENQRYPFKLGDKQTANMIKFAVTPPNDRWTSIQRGLEKLNWPADPILKQWGLQIDTKPVTVKARSLPVPKVGFANGAIQASEAGQGRWKLIGKKFKGATPKPLTSWGVMVMGGRGQLTPPQIQKFFQQFVTVYSKHGGTFKNKESQVPCLLSQSTPDLMKTVEQAYNGTGNKFKFRPELIFFVVLNRDPDTYNRIKKMAECRYGVVTQFVQSAHVEKNSDQYISNVCMKVHAKLGGFTSQADGAYANIKKVNKTAGKMMCIGADVSHPAPGAIKDGTVGSYAAMTMSLNSELTRYAAQVQTNGFRVEMVTTYNINNCLGKMVRHWMSKNENKLPDQVIYFRDGVSEGQYPELMNQEYRDIKALFRDIDPKNKTKFTLIVASKRHHVRFFPERGDRNGNPFPGCLVETGVTHPYQFDFYLAAHSAIKGTARPVHYTVLQNEIGLSADELQQMIFEHSFQYIRSTTPVSIHPAVYYAHLASQRARAHVDLMAGKAKDGKKGVEGSKKDEGSQLNTQAKKLASAGKGKASSTEDKTPTEVYPLLPIKPEIAFEMWYV
ncbi:Piwi domain-containing protein [Phyllosticta capitalensis]|uniref:Piwi domain-containing protein n=1 Tax=Phyllosticta capitalensis TaxID=121624 RepID=A0ABR1YXS5_9PEZI